MSVPRITVCRGCGQPIWFARTQKGARMPMDENSNVYEIIGHDADGTPIVAIRPNAWVSHFSTCKHSDQFSKRGTKTPGPTTEGQCRPPTSPRAS